MAGTAIFKKQNIDNISQTAYLNITLHSIQANISCCLWLKQPPVVESNNSKCKTNDRPMKENPTSNYHNSSSCALDDRILTNCNCNTKTLSIKQQQQPTKQRPLTLSVAVIISLSILMLQMPTMVQSKSIYKEPATVEDRRTVAETSAESDSKLLLSLLAEAQSSEYVSSLRSVDDLRHITHTQPHHKERRMRLRKRHTGDLIITQYLHESAHNLEWKNPCNVDHVNMEAEARHVTKQQLYQYLKKFEGDVSMEYEFITATANTININDMADWSKHDELYKFLPKLSVNGSIALSRWYRNMQVYVASFGYLARSQYKYDQKKRMFIGSTSVELNKLLASARFILCELETTINGSAPNNNLKKLRTISRRSMDNRLNFVTKHQMATSGGVVAANIVDLKFSKFSYYQFLSNMLKIINQKLQDKGKKYGIMDSSDDSSTLNSNTLIMVDDTSSLDFGTIFRSDSSLSLGESVEMLLKTTKKPHTQRHRLHKRKHLKSSEA